MKTNILKYILGILVLVVMTVGCTKDFDQMNTDPNRPTVVPTVNLISSAQKTLTDDIFDEWFSGRQGLLWSQYWAQRNYTEEDRFIIRQNTNNTYWRLLYTDMMDLQEIVTIASDPSRIPEINTYYGDAQGQVAAANILKAYVFQLLASTYGDVPYFEAFDAINNPTPAYTGQKEIFLDLMAKLTEAAIYFEGPGAGTTVFTSGDLMYDGDASKWAKFANSLLLKLAVRLSDVEDSEIANAVAAAITFASDGAFSSNADNAQIAYIGDGQSNSPLYDGFYTARRNDMTITANFVDLLKGINDTLNNKTNPFLGIIDPRIDVWVPLNGDGEYRGMPYGLVNQNASALRPAVANIYNAQPVYLTADATVTWMSYAEVCFILSELNGWDQAWYEEGIRASMEQWGITAGVDEYIASLPVASEETVLTQKYIALFMNGYEAWAEYRRTGYPKTILEVGEITGPLANGETTTFGPLTTGNDRIPRRLTYPVQEYTINPDNTAAAAAAIGGDSYNTKLIWDKQ